MVLAATPHGLAGLWFDDQRHLPAQLQVQASPLCVWPTDPAHPVLKQTVQQLSAYFMGQRTPFDVPLDLTCGSAFQQSVWRALLAIPLGSTVSYGHISRCIGQPTAARAVGAAVGRNPISVIVPCHRVVGADGALTGYAGGLNRKTALLGLEGAPQPKELL